MIRMQVVSIVFIAVLVSVVGTASATPPVRPDAVLESHTFGDYATLTGTSFTIAPGGFIICGYGDVPGQGIRGYAVNGDIYGNQYWDNSYGLPGDSYLYRIMSMPHPYYLMIGELRPGGSGGSQGLAVKIDANGTPLFAESYGDPGRSGRFSDVFREGDGTFLIAGTIRETGGNDSVWLVRIDSDGNVVTDVAVETNGSCKGEKIAMAYDGGYTIAGTIQTAGTTYQRAYVLHVDRDGNKLWEQTYGGPGSSASAIYPYAYGYVLACNAGGPRNPTLYRLNLSGAVTGQAEIGGNGVRHVAAIRGDADGGFVIVGDEKVADRKTAGFITKVTADGLTEWDRTFDGDLSTSLQDLDTFDAYYCAGTDGGRFWLLKIGSDAGLGPGPSSVCWCLPMLVLPALVIGLTARARKQR